MTVTHVGSTEKYSENWANVFQKKSPAGKKARPSKPAAKKAAAKAAKGKPAKPRKPARSGK